MELKSVFLTVRTTPTHRKIVQAVAALQGKTVSQLIDEAIIQKAVQRLQGTDIPDGGLQAASD